MRRRLLEEAEKVRNGEEPKAIIRDPKVARFVELPIIGRDFFLAGYSLHDVADGKGGFRYPKNFVFQAGQPEEITQAYRDAMGMNPDGTPRLTEAAGRV
jgi:5,5'-dehydrodivanillate O-demethylase